MDRSAANRALAKAIAYVECGQTERAAEWLEDLLVQFETAGVSMALATRRMGLSFPGDDGPDNDPAPLLDAQDLSAASGYFGRRLL